MKLYLVCMLCGRAYRLSRSNLAGKRQLHACRLLLSDLARFKFVYVYIVMHSIRAIIIFIVTPNSAGLAMHVYALHTPLHDLIFCVPRMNIMIDVYYNLN